MQKLAVYLLLSSLLCELATPFSPSLHGVSLPRASLERGIPSVLFSGEGDTVETENEDVLSDETPPSPPPKVVQEPVQVRPMDPLVKSLTRMDNSGVSENEPVKSLPLVGEVTLSKDLFLLVPLASFAILGLLSFLFIAFNSRDVFVDMAVQWNDSIMSPPAPPSVDAGGCRGLCSTQEQDLEGLRNFMNSLAK